MSEPSVVESGGADPDPAKVRPISGFNLHRGLAIVGIYVSAQFLAGVVLGIILGFTMAWSMATGAKEPVSPAVRAAGFVALLFVTAWAGGGGALAAAVHWGRGRFRDGSPGGFGFAPPRRWTVAAGLVLGLAVGAAYLLIATRLILPTPGENPFGFISTIAAGPPTVRALFALYGILLAPPLEEFLFRGVLLAGLRTRMRVVPAAIAVTGAFVLLHVTEAIAYWPALVSITVMGAVFVVLRIWSGSLYPGMLAHLAYNAVVLSSLAEG